MEINSVCGDFVAENFEIVNFNDENICFVWNERNQLVLFNFNEYDECSSIALSIIKFPKSIKSIKAYDKLSILTSPTGIYRLKKNNQEIVNISESAISNVNEYYQTLIFKNDYIWFEDKVEKIAEQLLPVEEDNVPFIKVLTLFHDQTTENLKKLLIKNPYKMDRNVTIIYINNNVYRILNDKAYLIYSGLSYVSNIVSLYKNDKVTGFALVSELKYIVVCYVKYNKLFFKKIFFNSDIVNLLIGYCEDSDNIIWILHSDQNNLYFSKKNLDEEGFVRFIEVKKIRILSLKYFNKSIFGLDDGNRLLKLNYDLSELIPNKKNSDDYIPVQMGMIKGSDVIMHRIVEKVKEFQSLNSKLSNKHNLLKRMSLYSYQQRNSYLPEISILRISNYLSVKFSFKTLLPLNCLLIVNIKSKKQTIVSSKLVENDELNIDVPIPSNFITAELFISIDLATFGGNKTSRVWCLIDNYFIEPRIKEEKNYRSMLESKHNFLGVKLDALKTIIQNDEIDITKVDVIKAALRKEMPDL